MKFIFIILDGVGDLPTNGLTPLQDAKKKNIDYLASSGINGLLYPVGRGVIPGSDTSHLALFGYDPCEYYKGRGPLEALGIGAELKQGDVAFRCNFATLKGGKVIDRRAGRISEGADELAKSLDGIVIDKIKIKFIHSSLHRNVLILRGKGLSSNVSEVDSHELGPLLKCIPLEKKAKKTADVVNKFVAESKKLENHPVNKKRIEKNLLPANVVLPRGPGVYEKIPSMKERYGIKCACIAGGGLYKGIAKYLGMDVIPVEGATGGLDTDLHAKGEAALKALEKYDFVFLHIKGTDNAGHDGDFTAKKEMLERIDKMVGMLKDCGEGIVLTGDHSTPVSLKRHSSDPIPVCVNAPGIRKDDVDRFDEKSAQKGGLGHLNGMELMPIILDMMGKSKIFGS